MLWFLKAILAPTFLVNNLNGQNHTDTQILSKISKVTANISLKIPPLEAGLGLPSTNPTNVTFNPIKFMGILEDFLDHI